MKYVGFGKYMKVRIDRSLSAMAKTPAIRNYDSIDRFIILFFLAANVLMTIANVLLIRTIYNLF